MTGLLRLTGSNFFEGAIKSTITFIVTWILILCRVAVGLVVIKTGFDYTRGTGVFAYLAERDGITGVFVMVIGAYIIFASLFRGLFDQSPGEGKK